MFTSTGSRAQRKRVRTSGTVTTTGSPANGNLTTFSGASSITNGDLSGDVTTSGTLVTALSTTGVSASTYGDSSHVGQFTVDAKGRITAATPVAIAGGTGASAVPILVTSNTTVSSGTGMVIPESLEIAAGVIFEVEGGARIEVTGRDNSGIATIFDQTLTASAMVIDTGPNGVPAGYRVLEIWLIARTDETAISSTCPVYLNNDQAAHYLRAFARDTNTSVTGGTSAALEAGWLLLVAGASASANMASLHRLTVPGYAQTTFFKQAEVTSSRIDNTAANRVTDVQGAIWQSTAAITQVGVAAPAGQKLIAGSRMIILGR